MSHVKRIKANNNKIREVKIEMSNNFITDIWDMTRLHSLVVLHLSANPLKNSIKGDILSHLASLTHLSLMNTKLRLLLIYARQVFGSFRQSDA